MNLLIILKPLRPETCGLIFMRAAMSALATVHAASYGYQESCGGREAFLERFPIIKDQNLLPRFADIKVTISLRYFKFTCKLYFLLR